MLLWIGAGVLGFFGLGFFSMFSRRREIQAQFLAYAQAHHPEMQFSAVDSTTLHLAESSGATSTINCRKLYLMVGSAGTAEERAPAFARWMAFLQESSAYAGIEDVAAFKDRVLPRVLPARDLARYPIPQQPLGETGLSTAFVIDSPYSVAYVDESSLQKFGSNFDEVLILAKENLRTRFEEHAFLTAVQNGQPFARRATDNHSAACLLLLPDLLPPDVELIACIPDRDTLLAMKGSSKEAVESVRKLLASMPRSGDTISTEPLRVSRAGIAAYRD